MRSFIFFKKYLIYPDQYFPGNTSNIFSFKIYMQYLKVLAI